MPLIGRTAFDQRGDKSIPAKRRFRRRPPKSNPQNLP
ncbi:hypothetical protein ABIC28_002717 [Rhodococcus sp. PvR044]|jgi:hypothetical protein|nr:hypothetical protein [Rhodococcus sp. PvR099]PTR43242.1 hypothetical protein C8K38_108113 [Rhodococcus sp. OK611]SNX91105.1 hypothetical protein SAMN05447004_108111 [Rhodococcus sp. OK270]